MSWIPGHCAGSAVYPHRGRRSEGSSAWSSPGVLRGWWHGRQEKWLLTDHGSQGGRICLLCGWSGRYHRRRSGVSGNQERRMAHPEAAGQALIPECVSAPPAAACLRIIRRGVTPRTDGGRRDPTAHGHVGGSGRSACAGSQAPGLRYCRWYATQRVHRAGACSLRWWCFLLGIFRWSWSALSPAPEVLRWWRGAWICRSRKVPRSIRIRPCSVRRICL